MSEAAGDDNDPFPRSVGEQLAAERQRQKLELSDIAARTRIPLRHLEAIESGRRDGLPALPYSAGFVKSYSNMLGLDGNALSRVFRDEVGDDRPGYFEPAAYEPVDPTRIPSRLLAMVALGVAVLLGMVYLLLRFEGDNSDLARLAADTVEDNRPVAAAPAVTPPPPPAAAVPAIPTGPIAVSATEDVWIKVSERAGKTYFMDVLPAGQSYAVPENAIDPILRTGRPQSVKVLVGTTALPAIGQPDRLVRAYSLKRDDLVAILTAKPATDGAVPPAVGNAADPAAAVPPAFRSAPNIYDPVSSRPGSTRPAPDSGVPTQP